jgi:peptidyl-prolyl cis-trans isomerase C
MKKWLKEPLVHFLVIGALIFVVFSVVNNEESTMDGNRIVVSAGDVERLSVNWSKKWNRPPTETELKGLVDSYIKEEVYYREALALGLDQNDTILRRRLMQKMEFLSNDLADLTNPDETDLNQYFLANQDKYELPARISFSHIYFSFDKKHTNGILEDAGKVLSDLRASATPVQGAPEKGDSFMLHYDFTLETPFEVARLFGQGFAEQIFQTETDSWQGPVESGYGLHLVRINEKVEARMPELASAIDNVRTDYMFEQRQKTNKAIYERFRERYEIVVENIPDRTETRKTSAEGGKSS